MIDTGRPARAAVAGLVIALTSGSVAHAQTPQSAAPTLLTLGDAISRGLAASHRLSEVMARGDAAEAVVAERHAALLPQLSAQAGYTRTNHVDVFGVALPGAPLRVIYPDIPDNYRTRLGAEWPIYTAGRLDAVERAARAEAAASADDLAAAKADLKLEIVRAYWALATADEAVSVVDESLRRTSAHLADVRNQFAVGLVPPNEVSSVEAQEARQRMLTIQARAMRTSAEAELARVTGIVPGTPLEPIESFDPPSSADADVSTLLTEARATRPERAAFAKRMSAASERQRAAAAGMKPTVAAAGGVDYARPNPRIFPRAEAWNTSWDASINVNWPLFDGGRSHAETAEAAASRRVLEERLAEFDVTLAAEVLQRANDMASSRATIDAATAAVHAAAEARRVVGDRFAAGVATSTEVLDAQVALLQAELDRTQAIATAHLADARLNRVVGR